MSFKTAIPHLEMALTHARAGNAAKSMHHIGHAMLNLRSMTAGAGGASKLPVGGGIHDTPRDDNDGDEMPPTGAQGTAPAAGSLRAKLAGLNGGTGGY